MNQSYQKFWESQQQLLDEWLKINQEVFQPEKKPAKKKTKGKGKAETDTGWTAAFTGLFRDWQKAQSEMNRKWWDALGESGWPVLPAGAMPQDSAELFKSWMNQMEKLWGLNDGHKNMPWNWWLGEGYSKLLENQYEWWKPQAKAAKEFGLDEAFVEKYFSPQALNKMMLPWLQARPGAEWGSFLRQFDHAFDQYIEFLDDVDLPFDEIAAFWDNLLVRFTPMDEVPLFRLGNNIHHYLEVMANPFYAIAGTPKLLRWQRLMRFVQFYYLSFIIKNMELRAKIFESSLSVFPATIRDMTEEFEHSRKTPTSSDFFDRYTAKLEKHLEKLLQTDEYTHLQNDVAETGVALKAKLDKMVELSLEGLPLMTKADEDDIAHEIQALRRKVRELSRESKDKLKDEVLPAEEAYQ